MRLDHRLRNPTQYFETFKSKIMDNKNNTGAIFRNDKKGNEKAPDYKGKVNVNGKDMEVALWVKEDKKQNKYFSASFSEPYVKGETKPAKSLVNDPEDSSLPF